MAYKVKARSPELGERTIGRALWREALDAFAGMEAALDVAGYKLNGPSQPYLNMVRGTGREFRRGENTVETWIEEVEEL